MSNYIIVTIGKYILLQLHFSLLMNSKQILMKDANEDLEAIKSNAFKT